MKYCKQLIQKNVIFFLIIISAATIAQAQSNNSITGHVFDAQTRMPVTDLYVELRDRVGFSAGQMRVGSSGGFTFSGLRAGEYQLKILTFGTNYEEITQDVRLVSLPLGNGRYSPDRAYVDIYLKLDPKKINIGSGGPATVVFVQEVPGDARKLYKKGAKQLDDKKDEGLDSLKKAIEIFPTYYDALDRLGREYVLRKQFGEAVPFLTKAVDVNKRSYSSFYALGIANYNLKNLTAAEESLNSAITANPQSINAQLLYGIVLRIDGKYEQAEKELLKAKSLSEKSVPVAEVHWQLGLLYEKTGRFKEAADELEQFLKIEPKTQDAEKIKKLIADLRAKAK
jgi:tetratricopeptide (TPR) repeat protein